MSDKAKNEEEDEPEEGAEGAEGEAAEGEGGEEGASKLDAKKIILFVVAPVVVLCAIGGGLYFTGMLDGLLGKGEHAEASAEGGGHGEKPALDEHGNPIPTGAAFLEIPTMIVNLNSPDGNPRYLRLSVQLELMNAGDKAAVEAVIPRVVDQFQTYLRELRVKDLRGSAGIYRLQMELLWRVNQAAAPIEVKDVLFQEILIQ